MSLASAAPHDQEPVYSKPGPDRKGSSCVKESYFDIEPIKENHNWYKDPPTFLWSRAKDPLKTSSRLLGEARAIDVARALDG